MLGLATSPRANTSTAADGLAAAAASTPAPVLSAAAATEFYTAYRSLTAVNRRMDLLAADYPGVAATIPIGKSVLGRQLTALAVGHTPADAPVRLVVLGLQHAREWVAGLVPLYTGEMLVRGAAEHPDLAAFLTRVQLLFVPMVNPDGFVYTVTTDRMWRKNRSDDGSTCPGVDLNRNWGVDWGGPHATSTVEPCRETYTGAAPFSEPETTAIRDLIDAHPGIVGFIDFHAYGELVLGAWAHAEEPPADRPNDKAYGMAVTDGVNRVHASGYRYGTGGEFIYLASGVASDWATAANMSAVTIELRPNNAPGAGLSLGTEFLLPASEVLPTCEEGMGGVIGAARFLERAARGGDDDLEPVDWVPLRGG
ncbi:hypothetical protein BU14_0074s0036 [Porphyra umbilicalis]|uniref:Peptidase M14 domain-containing protein n=1 Tax=Porphyra umbilicalis TaxID=2786 RepID=A0A1X6PFT5_PORUM|nr:hypothetical protein BU14_0074s0036 [Porphyra umbilicalis]|eukprot:OSX79606.1 hypothetical protein BU14_0074s0036 [Porphyra umbilicalis]